MNQPIIYRRRVVLGGLLTILFGSGACCAAHAQAGKQKIFGCILPDSLSQSYLNRSSESRLYITGEEPMISKSGDKDFDYALAQTLAKISTIFDVLPGFSYYDDADSENAYATPVVKHGNADGTVLFGIRLLKTLMRSQESPEVAVAAVCAHEFGHIVQFKHKLDKILGAGQPTVKRLELQADFFAGYFAGVRRREKPDFPAAVFAMTQYKNGDEMAEHPGHHGTPAERGKAIEEGFVAAYRHKKSFLEAIADSTSYVKSL